MSIEYEELGDKVYELRVAADIVSRKQLADEMEEYGMKCSTTLIGNIESGVYAPRFDWLCVFANLVNPNNPRDVIASLADATLGGEY